MAQTTQVGHNHNVRHKGHEFHVQTEDSGIMHPHIITHLFMDGGRILKSVKTSYAAKLDEPQLHEVVRRMMREQHKNMLLRLRDGEFDSCFEETRPGPESAAAAKNDAPAAPKHTAPLTPRNDAPPRRTTKQGFAAPPAPYAATRAHVQGAPNVPVIPPARAPQPSYSELPPLPPPRTPSRAPGAGRYELDSDDIAEEIVTTKQGRTLRPADSERSLNDLIMTYLEDDLD
jgi:type II secretory pathway component HofQ